MRMRVQAMVWWLSVQCLQRPQQVGLRLRPDLPRSLHRKMRLCRQLPGEGVASTRSPVVAFHLDFGVGWPMFQVGELPIVDDTCRPQEGGRTYTFLSSLCFWCRSGTRTSTAAASAASPSRPPRSWRCTRSTTSSGTPRAAASAPGMEEWAQCCCLFHISLHRVGPSGRGL